MSDCPIRAFVNFQADQYGAIPVADAAIWAKSTQPTIHKWARRGILKICVHRGKTYVGVDSLRDCIRVRVFFFGANMKGRLTYPKGKPIITKGFQTNR